MQPWKGTSPTGDRLLSNEPGDSEDELHWMNQYFVYLLLCTTTATAATTERVLRSMVLPLTCHEIQPVLSKVLVISIRLVHL